MNTLHDYEETGAEYEERQQIANEQNKFHQFIKTREKRIAIFTNMVKKFRREVYMAKVQGKFNF